VLVANDLHFNGIRNWPTIPQVYIGGEFVGGCDIVSTMFKDGELQEALGTIVPDFPKRDMMILVLRGRWCRGQGVCVNVELSDFGIDGRDIKINTCGHVNLENTKPSETLICIGNA